MTGPRPLPRLGYRPILGRLLSRLAPYVTRQNEVDEVGPARPLGERLRPTPGPAPERPIYTGGVPEDAPSPYRMADLSVGPDGVDVGRAGGMLEANLRRAPYANNPTPKTTQVDYAQLQADLGELERRRDDPTLAPDTRATYDAAATNLRQQIELGRRFGMGGTGASPAAQVGWNALDAVTLGLTGAAYQREIARRAEEGTLVGQEDVTALLDHPARTATVPQPGGLGVAGSLAGSMAAFMAGEGALKAGTMALRGTRFGALARPAEAYFKAAYAPIEPGTSALAFALKRGAQGALQGAPVGAVMDATRARLEGRSVGEGVLQGGLYGAALGGLMEASGVPSVLWGKGAPWEFARHVSADEALARATGNPFHRPFEPPAPPRGGEPPGAPPPASPTAETMVPGASPRQSTEPLPDALLPNLTPEQRAYVNHPDMMALLNDAEDLVDQRVIPEGPERDQYRQATAERMATPGLRGFHSPEEFRTEMGFDVDPSATRPAGRPPTVTLVTGLPGSGKTSNIVAKVMREEPWNYVVDSDQAAKAAPEWRQYGKAVRSALHPEATNIAEGRLLRTLVERGEDFIFSKIGSDPAYLREVMQAFKGEGYRVRLALADIPPDVAAYRVARRAFSTASDGHPVNLRYVVEGVGDKPVRAFRDVEGMADASRHLKMGIAPGDQPVILQERGDWNDRTEADLPRRSAGRLERDAQGAEGSARASAGPGASAPAAAAHPLGPTLTDERGFFGESFLPAEVRERLRATGQRLPATFDELQAMVAGLRDAEGRPQFDDLRARIDQLPPELQAASTALLDRAVALHERVSGATEGLADRVRPAALIGGLAAGGLAGAAAGGLLPDDTTATGKGVAAVAAFTAGLLAGTAGGAMVARSFGRGGARRMEFPELPARPTPVEVPVETRPEPGPAPRMEPEPPPVPRETPPTGPKPGEVIQGDFPSGKEAGALVKELAAQGQRAEVRRQKDGTFAVVAKGAKQESAAVAKVEQTELLPATLENGLPYTPGASAEQNRPARTDAGWALPVDEQGRFYSRLGRALEKLPAQRHTAAEWLTQMESAKGFSKLEYEAVLKPVLEKIAAGDPADAVFPWLWQAMGGSDSTLHPMNNWTDAQKAEWLAAWPTRKLTPDDLLHLAKQNRFQLTTVRLGSDQQTAPQAAPPTDTDPLGYATAHREWERGQDVTQHEAWTDHVRELEDQKDEAERHYQREYEHLSNLFDNADNVPDWRYLDTSDLEDAIRENYKVREKATEVWQEAWGGTDVSDAAYAEVIDDAKSHADLNEAVTGARMNHLLGVDAWDDGYRSEFDEADQNYVLYDEDGEEVARDRDHWTLWEEAADLRAELDDQITETADRLRDEAMPSLEDVVRYAKDAAEAHEASSMADSDYEDAANNWDEDQIREWLENEGYDLPDPDAGAPARESYGLAAVSYNVTDPVKYPLARGAVQIAVSEPATRDRPVGAPVYVDGGYLTPERSQMLVRAHRARRHEFTALKWNVFALAPYGMRMLPAWDGTRWRDFAGPQTLFRKWLNGEQANRREAVIERDLGEMEMFFPWARRTLTDAERATLREVGEREGAPAATDALRQIAGLPTVEEMRLLRDAFENRPLEMDGSVFNAIIGRDLFPADLVVQEAEATNARGARYYYLARTSAPTQSLWNDLYSSPTEAWRYGLQGQNSPSHSAHQYGAWRRNDYNISQYNERLAPFEGAPPAGVDPVREWYKDNLYMPDAAYDPAAHGMVEGADGRLLRAFVDGSAAAPPHEAGEVVYDEEGKYWGPGEYRYQSPGVLDVEDWRPGTPTLDLDTPPVEGAIPTRAIPGPPRDPATLFAPPEASSGGAQYSGYVMRPGPGMSPVLDYREVLTVIPPAKNPLEPEGAAPVFGDNEHYRQFPVVHHMTRMQEYETHENGVRDFLLMGQEGQSDPANTAADRAAGSDLIDKVGATKYGTRRRTYTAERVAVADVPDLVTTTLEFSRAATGDFERYAAEVQEHFRQWRADNGFGEANVESARAYIATPEGKAKNDRLEAVHSIKVQAENRAAWAERLGEKAKTTTEPYVEVEGVENPDAATGTFVRDNTTVGEMMVKRLLLEWAERGRGTLIGWSNAAMLNARWGRKKIFETVYDTAPSRYARLYLDRLLGKELSARIDIYNKGGTEDHAGNGWRIRIPHDLADEVRRRILANGVELMSAVPLPLVLMAATMDEAQQDEATRDLLRLAKGAGLVAAGGLALYGAARGVRALRRFRTRPELPHTAVEAEAVAPVTPEALPTAKRASEGRVGRGKVPNLTKKEVSRLGLPAHLELEVVQAVTEQRGLVGGPEVVSNEEMLRRAQAELDVGEEALIDLDPTRATAPQIIAIASLAGQKKRTADLFWQRAADPSLAASEQRANAKMAERMDEDFLALMTGSMRGSSEAGRTLNAMKLLANLRPDPDYWWRRTMKMLDRPLTPEERVQIDTFLKHNQRAELVQYLARLKKTSIPAQIVTLMNAGLFTRPAARALDLISSGGNLLLEHGVNAPARVLLDRAVALATGARTATLPGALQMQGIGRGMYHGLQTAAKSMGWHAVAEAPAGTKWQAWVDYMRNVEMTPEMLARYDLPHLTNIDLFSLSRNPEAPANVVMDLVQKTIYRTLGFSDRILVGAAYEGAVADLAMARALAEQAPHPKQRAEELIANPPDDLRFDAMLMASRITFNNEEAMARLSKLVMRAPGDALRKVEGPVGDLSGELADAGMRWQFPVVRTVANITARALDYVPPIGTARGFYNLWSAFRAGLDPSLKTRKQRVAVEVLSRNLTGSALVAVGAYLYQQGVMTGAASTDPAERNLATGIGQTPNSLLWNGEWVPIGRLPPFGTLLAVGATLAQIAERSNREGGKLGYGAGAAFAVGRSILDQPFLSGSRSALDALQDPVTRSENYLEQQVGRLVPTFVAEVAAADGLARDVNGPLDALKARLPGLRDDLPVQVTGYGDPMQGRTGLVNRLFNPFAGSPDQRVNDPVLARSYELGYIPGRVARDKATPTTPRERPEEYARRAAFVGGLRKTMVGNAMATHPIFTDPAYLDKLARRVVQVDPDYAGLTLDEAKRKLQQALVQETSEDISPHEDPAQVPRRFGGQR